MNLTQITQITSKINETLDTGIRAKIWNGSKATRIYINQGRTELLHYEISGKDAVRNGKNFGMFDWDTGTYTGQENDEDYGASLLESEGFRIIKGR